MPDAIDPYKTLQVDPEAEEEVVTAAYRRLARKYHPDLASTPDAAARMAAINAAWELIGDPAKRAMYDRLRRAGQARATAWEGSSGRAGASSAWGGSASGGSAGSAGSNRGAGGSDASSGYGGAQGGTGPRGGAGSGRSTGDPAASPGPAPPPPPDLVSRDWTSGRSSQGGGFDESMRAPQGHAGPPPGRPSGRVLNFGRYAGWSLGEIARQDILYLEWLDRMPIGRPYRDDIDGILRSAGRRRSEAQDADHRRGLYRRR